MNEQEKNEEALEQLGIEIPEGYEFVRYGYPQKDDYWIGVDGLAKSSSGTRAYKHLVIKEKIETDCWYLVEDNDGDVCARFLNEGEKWMGFTDPKFNEFCFSFYKIISKMEVVK